MKKITQDVQSKMEEIVKDFHKYDSDAKAATKLKDPLNKEIKTLMSEHGLNSFEVDGIEASYAKQERVSMNEAKLIEVLKTNGYADAIIQVEKPDTGKIEELIYEGKLKPALLEQCNETKIVEVLSVKKKKAPKK